MIEVRWHEQAHPHVDYLTLDTPRFTATGVYGIILLAPRMVPVFDGVQVVDSDARQWVGVGMVSLVNLMRLPLGAPVTISAFDQHPFDGFIDNGMLSPIEDLRLLSLVPV